MGIDITGMSKARRVAGRHSDDICDEEGHMRTRWWLPYTVCAQWCGRGESNPHRPFSPTDFHTTTAFAAASRWRLWSGLSLHRGVSRFRCCPSSLYTFPFRAWLGIAIAKGFPEFEQFCISGFPESTQVRSSPLRLPFRHARLPPRLIVCGLPIAKKKHDQRTCRLRRLLCPCRFFLVLLCVGGR